MDQYIIPILFGIYILIFPAFLLLKKRYYPAEYKKEAEQFSNIWWNPKFFIILMTLTVAYELLDVFNKQTTITREEIISRGIISIISLAVIAFAYKPNMERKAKRFLMIVTIINITMLASGVFIYFVQR